jgi:uncharacterized protein
MSLRYPHLARCALVAATCASLLAPVHAADAPPKATAGTPAGVATGAAPAAPAPVVPSGPSFSCKGRLSAVQKLVCDDAALSALDRKLTGIVSQVTFKEPREVNDQSLAVVQRQWLRERESCATTPEVRKCVSSLYRTRIAELQGQYGLVPVRGPFRFACTGSDVQLIVMTYFETDPPSATLETATGTNLMFVAPSGSGARYVGDGVTYWEAQGEATLTFAGKSTETKCRTAA